ncbi:hypothetical protein N9741_03500 [Octadecabacter sp.]|nr:hypothetical protein [Octadecabacter sp.]
MNRMPMTSDAYRRKAMSLQASLRSEQSLHQIAMKRAVTETLRNPVVVRAVTRALRPDMLEKI